MLLSVYIPTVLFSFGQGLLVPILPLYAADFGGSFALAGFVVAAGWLGTMIADLPVGMLLRRIGFKRAMILGAALFGIATIALGFARSPFELILLRLLAGVGIAFWGISRHAFIAHVVTPDQRGRAIAVFGGIGRIGHFIGPAAGGFVAVAYSLPVAIMVAGAVATLIMPVAGLLVREPSVREESTRRRTLDFRVFGDVIATNPRGLAAGGTAQVFAQMIRAGRQIVIPLYGAYVIGLDPAQVGQIVSLSSMIDIFLFIPAGIIMDRWGRKAAAVPSFTIMGLGMLLIPLANSFGGLLLVGMLIGFGNGIGSGTMMTLGADLAPPGRAGEFLGLWRFIGDGGQTVSSLLIGSIADVIGLALTSGMVGGLGFISAGTLVVFVRETRWQGERARDNASGDRSRSSPPAPGGNEDG
jgi:MFS family permease